MAWPALTTGSVEIILKGFCKVVCQAWGSHFQAQAISEKPILSSKPWSQDLVPARYQVRREHPLHLSSHHNKTLTLHGGQGKEQEQLLPLSAHFAGSKQCPCSPACTQPAGPAVECAGPIPHRGEQHMCTENRHGQS